MRWKLLNAWLDFREWLWIKVCNPPRCNFCGLPMDKNTMSFLPGVCSFCDEKREPLSDFEDSQAIFERDPYDELL